MLENYKNGSVEGELAYRSGTADEGSRVERASAAVNAHGPLSELEEATAGPVSFMCEVRGLIICSSVLRSGCFRGITQDWRFLSSSRGCSEISPT